MDTDALFPGRDSDIDDTRAIAEVCARLGRAPQWSADDGYAHEIVGGAVDGERVAWVEERSQTTAGGWTDIEFVLRLRVGDELVRAWIVDTYNPYFGCSVGYLRWWGDEVAAIYREKHRTLACAVGPSGPPRLRMLAFEWRVLGDVVLHASRARGLVERIHLPSLTQGTPLPYAAAAERMSSGTCEHGPPLAAAPAELQRRIVARLPAIPRSLAELLVGALAYRFWDPWPPVVASYEAVSAQGRWNPPCWLPFYHYCASEPSARPALLAQLDAVAARAPADCDPADEAAELACRHIAARCRELAAACRAGHLPEGASCYFWVEWSQKAFAGAQELFPGGMWSAWQALRPRARELDALARSKT